MPIERGFFDARTRAFMALGFPVRVATLQIDTGFNGDVLVGDLTAQGLGLVTTPAFIMVHPAGNSQPFRVQISQINVTWLGQARLINVFVYPNEQPRPRGAADGLLGTGLIHPDRLVMDYINDVVEITN